MMPAPGASPPYMPVCGERRELEERAALVEQPVDPVARQQLAAGDVALARGPSGPPSAAVGEPLAQLADERRLLAASRRPCRSRVDARRAGSSCGPPVFVDGATTSVVRRDHFG